MKTVGIIPVRLTSERFSNKVLQRINGKRIIDHIIENTRKIKFIDEIVIATDDREFALELCSKHVFLRGFHLSYNVTCGSHRAYKFYLDHPDYDYYMTIPADEPSIDPDEVNKVLSKIDLSPDEIISFYTKFFCKKDLKSPLSCKIVTCEDNYMLYNSRNVIPVNKDGSYLNLEQYKKHVGMFIFPRSLFYEEEDLWEHTIDIESLEQNRFIQKALDVKMIEMKHIGFGIDMPEQINQLEERLRCRT